MTKEMDFFVYLIECYAYKKGVSAADILNTLNEKNLIDYVIDMYEMYHSEAIENAFADLDSLIATGKPTW